jgi:hypothetical protein
MKKVLLLVSLLGMGLSINAYVLVKDKHQCKYGYIKSDGSKFQGCGNYYNLSGYDKNSGLYKCKCKGAYNSSGMADE